MYIYKFCYHVNGNKATITKECREMKETLISLIESTNDTTIIKLLLAYIRAYLQ